jgi:hypothetical protein
VQAGKILATISHVYGVNPSISWQCIKIKKKENETCESVKWLKCAKLEDLEDALVIWNGGVVKNGTATDEFIKEQAKILGQQMSVTNVIHKN